MQGCKFSFIQLYEEVKRLREAGKEDEAARLLASAYIGLKELGFEGEEAYFVVDLIDKFLRLRERYLRRKRSV
jgi:hypothetical protein